MIKVWSKRKSMTTYCWMITAILGPSVCTSAESSTAHSRIMVSWNNRKSLSNIWQCFLLDIYWWKDCKSMLNSNWNFWASQKKRQPIQPIRQHSGIFLKFLLQIPSMKKILESWSGILFKNCSDLLYEEIVLLLKIRGWRPRIGTNNWEDENYRNKLGFFFSDIPWHLKPTV